jgi:hypothetical protein
MRFEYDSINVNTNGNWLPKNIPLNSTVVIDDDIIKQYAIDIRGEYKLVQRFSKDELGLDETITLISAGLALDEENSEVLIIITDQFSSFTFIDTKLTFQFSK